MTEPKLTPAMRRVLERMAKGCVVVYNTRTGKAVWGDNGNLVRNSDLVASFRSGFVGGFSKGRWSELWVYRITPKGRKALERTQR